MKTFTFLLFTMISVSFMACNSGSNKPISSDKKTEECYASKDSEYAKMNNIGGYGAAITTENAQEYVEFLKTYDGKTATKTKIKAKVTGVCEVKGCWMSIDNGSADGMMVHFKDYAFFVPRDIKGKTVIIEGMIQPDTTTVEELRHYAVDAGKSKDEIAKITEPKVELTFMADGVIVKK